MTLTAIPALEDGRGVALRAGLLALIAASLAACAGGPKPQAGANGEPTPRYSGYKIGKPYQVRGVWYYPKDQPNYDEIGIASWYGEQFHEHYTADGEIFDMGVPSAAHKTLPLPSLVEVTNLANGRTVIVRVNDRGPFVSGRVIDLSKAAAEELGFVAQGVTKVRVRYVGQAKAPPEPKQQQALNHLPTPKAPVDLSSKAVQLAQSAIPQPPPGAPPLAPPLVAPPLEPPPGPMMTVAAAGPVAQTALASIPASGPPSYVAQAAQTARTAAAPSGLSDVDNLLADAPPAAQAASVASTAQAAAPAASAAATAISPPPPVSLQVQAGVFASRANAELLASRLAGAGAPEVQPFEKGGQTFYRVVVHGFSNPAAAAAARTQAAAFGAPDARVIGGL